MVPFNPDVITDLMMAPSVDTSVTVNNPLPLPLDEATQIIANFIAAEVKKSKHIRSSIVEHNNQELRVNDDEDMIIGNTHSSNRSARSHTRSDSGASVSSQDSTAVQTAHQIVGRIANSSSAYLLHSSPLCSDQPPPIFMPHPFSPMKNQYAALLMEPAMTEREESLGNALQEAAGQEEGQKDFLMGMQATTILQGAYVQKARAQIQAQEEKARDKRWAGKLHADGCPRLISKRTYVDVVVAQDKAKAAKAAEKASRQAQRQEYGRTISNWKKAEKLRKERNQD